MKTEVVSFHEDADAQQAAPDVADLYFPAVHVVDDHDRLSGIVRTGTPVDVVSGESTEDMLRMAGMDLPEI